jgi:RHS repeat-associated protein
VPIVTYTYRKDDLLKTINYRDLITGEFSYDEAGRKIGVSYTDTNGVIFSENVEIDNKGNILSENRYYREENPNSQSYILPSESYTYNSKNHLLEAGGNTFSVNDDGNTTLRSTPAGIPGVNDPGVANFDYDVDDNLTNITNSNIPGYNKTYKYDPYGNRIEKSLGSNATKYTWDILNNNVLIIDTPNLSKLYNFYGATGLEYSIYGDTGTREYILYLGDLRGSVVAVANPVGDSSYNYNFNKYDDFGNRTYGAFGNPHQVFKYLGKHGITLEDVHTGHYYIKARHYDAITGRFLTQDPIWSTNLYPYGDNNPISRIDFNGKQSQSYFFRGEDPWVYLSYNFSNHAQNFSKYISSSEFLIDIFGTTETVGQIAIGTGIVLTATGFGASAGLTLIAYGLKASSIGSIGQSAVKCVNSRKNKDCKELYTEIIIEVGTAGFDKFLKVFKVSKADRLLFETFNSFILKTNF